MHDIPRVLGAVGQKLWTKTKYIWETYFGHMSDQIYIINHNIEEWEIGNNWIAIEEWSNES